MEFEGLRFHASELLRKRMEALAQDEPAVSWDQCVLEMDDVLLSLGATDYQTLLFHKTYRLAMRAAYQSGRDSIEWATRASNGKRLIGATSRAKIAKEERAKVEAEIRAMRSAAGAQGGKARSDTYEPIKQWALEKASKMRGEHKQIARQLHAILPKHFADISLDPERLIYEALRANSK